MSTVDIRPTARGGRVASRRSLVIYLGLLAYLALVKVVLDLGSVDVVVRSQAVLFSWPMIGFLAVVGGLCVWLGPRAGIPELWDPTRSPRKWLFFPAVAGLGLGATSLTVQALTGYARVIADAANVPTINVRFPESILFYSGGAVVVESLYRLIAITLPLWLIVTVILRGRGQAPVFWTVALLTSLIEANGQMSLVAGHPVVMLFMGVGMYGLNIVEALLFRRHGFLAPLVFRCSFYLVWHVVASALGV
jgi:hypothetical protein